MKKSILQRMADVESRNEAGAAATPEKAPLSRRHSSPVISNVGKVLTQLSEDSIVALDPAKIERSPFRDRFDEDAEAEKELEVLKLSIAAEGQKIPVLVRPHPVKSGHYQLAYGYRRLAAIKAMMEEAERPETVKIKAYVRELTDRQLIEEQSLENGVRENLTWIEQAMWAVQLKSAGLSHRGICPILGLSEAGVSHLFRVTSVVPEDIIYAIGRARTVGRPKWTALAEALKDPAAIERVRGAVKADAFRQADGPGRIALALRAATAPAQRETAAEAAEPQDFAMDGRLFGRMKSTAAGVTLIIPPKEAAFAQWLAGRMPELMRTFDAGENKGGSGE